MRKLFIDCKLFIGRICRRLARVDSGLSSAVRYQFSRAALTLAPICGAITVDLTVQRVDNDGIQPTFTGSLSTGNTYQFPNDGRTILNFIKTITANCVVTIPTPATTGGLAVADMTVTVGGTTGNHFIGPFSANLFNDANGNVTFTLSEINGLSVAVLRV